jgi:hypothetical protein
MSAHVCGLLCRDGEDELYYNMLLEEEPEHKLQVTAQHAEKELQNTHIANEMLQNAALTCLVGHRHHG